MFEYHHGKINEIGTGPFPWPTYAVARDDVKMLTYLKILVPRRTLGNLGEQTPKALSKFDM